MARLVEMLQIEPVAISLRECRPVDASGTQLVLDDENNPCIQHDQIGPTAHSRDQKFQKEVRFRKIARERPQVLNLKFPSGALGRFNSKRQTPRELAIELLVRRICHFRRRDRNIRSIHRQNGYWPASLWK